MLRIVAALLFAAPALAQEFHDHISIWSTEDGGGQLVTDYDFADKRPPLFFSESCPLPEQCIYSTSNPAFLTALPADDNPDDGLYPLKDGTSVSIELVAIAAGLSVNIGGTLDQPHQSAKLGMAPFHTHPTWQLVAPRGTIKEYEISFKLTTDSPDYTPSGEYALTFTSEQPFVPTATPAPTATPGGVAGCPGDCNDDEVVSVDELVVAVMIMLGDRPASDCPELDARHDGAVKLDELVMAVDAAMGKCAAPTLTHIQDTIFTPVCATEFCHSRQLHSGNLVLEKGASRGELVNVAPDNLAARMQGFFLVAPGNPGSSFLLVKLLNPQPILGSRMPLGLPQLPADQIDLIRKWIAQGARP